MDGEVARVGAACLRRRGGRRRHVVPERENKNRHIGVHISEKETRQAVEVRTELLERCVTLRTRLTNHIKRSSRRVYGVVVSK